MKKGSLLLAFCFCLLCENSASAQELRGLWVDAFGEGFWTREQVTQLVQDCRDYNFNAVFVQMRKRGDAFYNPRSPNLDPKSSSIDHDFDPLAEIIRQCHGAEPKIEVHCWLVAYLSWAWKRPPLQREHIFNRHPEYFTKDSLGQRLVGNAYYLDPGHPRVGIELLNVARDIVTRYEIDGLHWDYLRYPTQDSGYNDVAIRRYNEESETSGRPHPTDVRFSDWRRRQVTDFLRWSSAELLEFRPALIISASVFANYADSSNHRFADWAAWAKEGILDVVVPMNFSPDSQFIFKPRADFAAANQWNRAVWMGQGAYMNTLDMTLSQLHYSREKGFPGTVLYSYRNPVSLEAGEGVSRNDSFIEPMNGSSGRESALTFRDARIVSELTSTATRFRESETDPDRVDISLDDSDAEIVGDWRTGQFGEPFGPDYRFKTAGTGDAWASFSTNLPVAGEYDVYEWHVAGENRAEKVPHRIQTVDGPVVVTVNQRINGSRWNFLGRFRFDTNAPAEVRISDAAPSEGRVVMADGIRFILATDSDSPVLLDQDQIARENERLQQASAFERLKRDFQPTWTSVPPLPWKTNPVNGIVKGTIINPDTGAPVYNAIISLNASPERTQRTDPHGTFAFFEVPPGNYRITVQYPHKELITEVTITPGQITTLSPK